MVAFPEMLKGEGQIFSCIGSGIFRTGCFEMPEKYNGRTCGRSFSFTSSGEYVAVRRVGVFV